MRCHKVTSHFGTQYAATTALAREVRESMMAKYNIKKKDVTIEPAEIPTAKPDLLKFVNDLLEKIPSEATCQT